MEDLHLKIETTEKEVVLLQGKALDPYYKNGIKIEGLITCPAAFVGIRSKLIDVDHAHLNVFRSEMILILTEKEDDVRLRTQITGSLTISEEIEDFKINKNHVYSSFELADFIKMHRSYFESKEIANALVVKLRSFKARVNKEIENFKDDKGNYSMKRDQVVNSETPDGFRICVPVFKGFKKVTIEVEIVVNPESLGFSLVSPDLSDFIADERDAIFDEEIKKITDLISIPVFEC